MNTKFFTKSNVKSIREQIEEAVRYIAAENGVELISTHGRFDTDELKVTIDLVVIDEEKSKGLTEEALKFGLAPAGTKAYIYTREDRDWMEVKILKARIKKYLFVYVYEDEADNINPPQYLADFSSFKLTSPTS